MRARRLDSSVGFVIACALGVLNVCASPFCTATDDFTPPAKASAVAGHIPLAAYLQGTVETTLTGAQTYGDVDSTAKRLATLFDQTIAWSKDTDPQSIEEADLALRLARDVQKLPVDEQRGWLTWLRANPDLAGTLVFLIKPGQKPEKIFELLKKLRDARGPLLEKYANLTAAICVDHATPQSPRVGENRAKEASPLEIFDFYVKNEPRMFFGVRDIPAELLVWVVDTTASIDEMNWALAKYAGNRDIGARFFDIKYDYDNFEKGTPEKVYQAGYSLPNILRYGGICADQAYFAMAVGKSIGVPTAWAVGASADSPHAWVGFLQAQGKTGHWNFDSGRYPEYQGVRGEVTDPQTRKGIPDSYVSVLGEMIGTRAIDRQTGAALVDAAQRLLSLEKSGKELEPAPFPADANITNLRSAARQAATADTLALAELALKESAGYPPAWFVVRDAARADKLSIDDKRRWSGVLQKLGSAKYPDFTLAVLMPMIQTIPDVRDQDAMWNAAFVMFQSRFDLAASIRMEQAAMWQSQGNTINAGACYMDVIDRYADAGPFVMDALKHAEKLLKEPERQAKVILLYQRCWAKCVPPPANYSQIIGDSNWYRVGKLYAGKLKEAGDAPGAQAVLDKLMSREPH